jgi:preprotein translocase subunit SecF
MQQPTGVLDIVGKRGWFYLVSLIILLPGIISLIIPPRLKLGIDFSSGSTFTVRFEKAVQRDALKSELSTLDHPEARVQSTGNSEFIVRTKVLQGAATSPPIGPAPPTEKDTIEKALRAKFGNMADATGKGSAQQGFLEFSSIDPTVSGKLSLKRSPPFICCGITGNAVSAVTFASLAIFIYLWWSFRAVPQSFRFGAAAVLAMIHDAVIVLGIFSILGKLIDTEIDVFFVTAIMTVIGFSVHDSIVVFDRIRETVARGEGRNFTEMVNNSLLQTLGRSLNTTLTLIFATVTLLLIGGSSVRDFLLAMLIGTVTGAYSSIFIASQILVSWEEQDVPRIFRRLTGRPERPAQAFEPPEALPAEA